LGQVVFNAEVKGKGKLKNSVVKPDKTKAKVNRKD
jgi:hypothetical protein